VHLRVRVYGEVQGVFFRASAADMARSLGVAGFARNEPDGTVTVEVEGAPDAVERLRVWCETGPPQARVKHTETVPLAPIGDNGFHTR
jgi:acylphosphatase